MKNRYCNWKNILLLYLIPFQFFAQKDWRNLTTNAVNEVNDIVMDNEGNCYVSIMYHPLVFKIFHINGKLNFSNLGKFYTKRPFYGTHWQGNDYQSLLHYSQKGELRVNANVGFYVYKNDQFEFDTLNPDGIPNPKFASFPDIVKQDLHGSFFNRQFNRHIYKFKSRLFLVNEQEEVFTSVNGDIRDFVVIDSLNNYALVKSNSPYLEVWKFYTHQKFKKRIIETSGTVWYSMAATNQGDIFIPGDNGLLHFSEEGTKVDFVQVDSTVPFPLRSYYVCWSLNQDILFLFTLNGIYASYDMGKNWIRPYALNRKFPHPEGIDYNFPRILKFLSTDTLNAYTLIQNGCNGNRILWYMDEQEDQWKECSLDLIYPTYSIAAVNSSKVVYANSIRDCSHYKSMDGIKWDEIVNIHGRPTRNLYIHDRDMLFNWEPYHQDTFLYKSVDDGNNWKPVMILKWHVFGIYSLSDQELLMFTAGTNNTLDQQIRTYLSRDSGESWELKYRGPNKLPDYFNLRITLDKYGELYCWYPNFENIGVFVSRDNGINWSRTDRFKSFVQIYNIHFDQSNKAIISGKGNFGNGVFFEDEFGEFEIAPFDKSIVYYGDSDLLVGLNKNYAIEISSDLGKTWEDWTGNLPINLNERIPSFNSFYLDGDGYLYTSLNFQGIFKTLSPLVSVHDTPVTGIEIFPNPSNDYLKIQMGGGHNLRNGKLVICEFQGREIIKQNLNVPITQVDINGLMPGMYLVHLFDQGKLLYSYKWVKYK